MAYLYVWEGNQESWGHASLLLEESQTYISWWPKDDKAKHSIKNKKANIKGKLPDSYTDDVNNYTGRVATNQFYISTEKIDCAAVKSWWESKKGDGGYHFLRKNCCDVIYEALENGGCYSLVSPDAIALVSTPGNLAGYAGKLEKATSKK